MSSAVTVAGLAYVMIRLDWQIALIVVTLSPPLILARRFYRSVLNRRRREANDLEHTAMAVIAEGLGPLRNVTGLSDQQREPERFLRSAAQAARGRARVKLAEGRFGLILGVIAAVGMAAVVFLGMDHVRAGVLSLGNLLVLIAYAAQLQKPIRAISRNTGALRGCVASAKRTFALLDQLPAVTQHGGARPIARARGAVSFRGVSLSFDGGHTVLYGVSFEIDPGSRLGIAGATSAAKGALISLLTRLCDPTEGRILLDGVDLRDYRLDDLRRQFVVVPWKPALSSRSIAENIAGGAPYAREQIVAAARAANAHDWVERLPDGYDTKIKESGLKLSRAWRQSLGLARAFLSDSPVLILERPTRAVAVPADAALADALERLMQGRTVIAIGGHPSTVAGCSEVLQLEGGRIVGGTTRFRIAVSRPPSPDRAGMSGDVRLDRTRLLAHPAVQAWCRLGSQGPLPTRVVPAKVKTLSKKTTNVYRLEGVEPGGGAVIAKKCKPSTGAVERLVYEEYLPSCPSGAPVTSAGWTSPLTEKCGFSRES